MSMRSHYAGSLRASDDGTEVALCGWVAHRRDHGGVVFIDLRDREGIVQVVLDPGSPGCAEAHRLRSEYVIRVEGAVRRRPEGMVNPKEPTGEIEVGVTALTVLNEAEPPPFPLDDRVEVDEARHHQHLLEELRRLGQGEERARHEPGRDEEVTGPFRGRPCESRGLHVDEPGGVHRLAHGPDQLGSEQEVGGHAGPAQVEVAVPQP